jgi:hypothetical protein
MYYAIFSCRLTLELLSEYGERYGVFVPIEHERRFNDRKRTVEEGHRAAIPGFAFVPIEHSKEIRRRVPEAYNLRQLLTFNGHECLITRKELDQLQDRLELEYTGAYTFKQGDKVIVHFHPLSKHGAEGEIVKFRSSGKARVKLRKLNSFVEVPQILLSKVG